ncbi:MAG: hypothetical protein GEV08_23550 [Acidimicrobiia bacterium]|nr:hypothetical protein [Acidimicrobiia bacterium]
MRVPPILFPTRQLHPLRSIARRIGLSVGILVLVAMVTWTGRHGYRDADGGPLSLLDAFYYASVTVTTTGYGDITPISPTARAVTAFVVTPARVVFLILLVGTTLELLTERFRQALAESRWRKRVRGHTIVAGYGTKGRGAVDTLLASGTLVEDVVVIDVSAAAVEEARNAGFTAILGDATRTPVLQLARVEQADAVVVTCHRDDTATLVTLTARELNGDVTIVAAVREAENAHLLRQSGAATVIVSAEAAGRLLGLATDQPRAVAVLEDLLIAGQGLRLVERAAREDEVGGPPLPGEGLLPIAVVREGARISFDSPAYRRVQAGDVVISIGSE